MRKPLNGERAIFDFERKREVPISDSTPAEATGKKTEAHREVGYCTTKGAEFTEFPPGSGQFWQRCSSRDPVSNLPVFVRSEKPSEPLDERAAAKEAGATGKMPTADSARPSSNVVMRPGRPLTDAEDAELEGMDAGDGTDGKLEATGGRERVILGVFDGDRYRASPFEDDDTSHFVEWAEGEDVAQDEEWTGLLLADVPNEIGEAAMTAKLTLVDATE